MTARILRTFALGSFLLACTDDSTYEGDTSASDETDDAGDGLTTGMPGDVFGEPDYPCKTNDLAAFACAS